MMLFPAKISRKIDYPMDWKCISRYQTVQRKLIDILNEFGPTMYGEYLLRIGPFSQQLDWDKHSLRRELNILCNAPSKSANLNSYLCNSDYHSLAIQEHGMDAILALHALDFSSDPHTQLREFDRVLRSDGYLIMTGFNPTSLSGLAHLSPWFKQNPLKSARYFSALRVKDWLSLLNFEVIHTEYLAGHNLLAKSQKDKALGRFESLACLRSMYVIIARKRETPLNLIAPKFAKIKPQLRPAAAHLNTVSRR